MMARATTTKPQTSAAAEEVFRVQVPIGIDFRSSSLGLSAVKWARAIGEFR
jgi:hypothetical protein